MVVYTSLLLREWAVYEIVQASVRYPHFVSALLQVALRFNLLIPKGPEFDPYAYSSGRWLRNDKQERGSCYKVFDFNGLCQKVVRLSGASAVTACEKMEGGFSRVFIFTLDNEKRVVAKLPFIHAGPRKLTTASEVATMKYCQSGLLLNVKHCNNGHCSAN